MSQADPSRHIDASLHGSSPKVQETTSPVSELQGADAVAMPSRGRRGGVVEKDADCMKKDPEINAGSPEMGGSRDEGGEIAQLLRDADAEEFVEAFVDTLLKQGLRRSTHSLMHYLHKYLRIPLFTAARMIKMAQAAPQEPPPARFATRLPHPVSEHAELDLTEREEHNAAGCTAAVRSTSVDLTGDSHGSDEDCDDILDGCVSTFEWREDGNVDEQQDGNEDGNAGGLEHADGDGDVEAQMQSLFVVSPTKEEDAEKAPDHSFGLDLSQPSTQGTGSTGTGSSTDPYTYQYRPQPPDPEPPPTSPGNGSEITDEDDDIEALFAGCVSTFQWDHGEEL
eukprot:g2783.t1